MYKRAFRAIAATFRSDSASIDSMLMFRAEEHMFSPAEKNVVFADRDYLHIDTLYLDIHEMLHLPRAQHPVYSVCFSRIINDTVLLAHVIEEKEREKIYAVAGISHGFRFVFDKKGGMKKCERDTIRH